MKLIKKEKKLDKKLKPILDKAQAMQELSDYCKTIKKRVNDADDLGDRIDKKEKIRINKDLEEAIEWLDNNPNSTSQEIKEKKKEVEEKVKDTIERADAEKKI